MRISNVDDFLGGANNLIADQIVAGAARHVSFTINDANNMPLDLTGYTIEYDTIQATTPMITPGRGGSFTVAPMALEDGAVPIERNAFATTPAPTTGVIDLYIPNDYYTGTVPFDTNENVPCVIGNLRYFPSATVDPEIGVIRTLFFIRYGVIAP